MLQLSCGLIYEFTTVFTVFTLMAQSFSLRSLLSCTFYGHFALPYLLVNNTFAILLIWSDIEYL